MSAREPNSWLRLEQHHLGELTEIGALSDADRACLAHIEADDRPLPPLQLPERRRARFSWWVPSFGLAAATVLAVLIWHGMPGDEDPVRTGIKGGELAMVVVRERNGVIEEDPTTFEPGDRFKIQMTCAAAAPMYWDVVVEQRGARFHPLSPADPVSCGSRVTLPGAFELSGPQPVVICLVVQAQPWQRGGSLPDGPCLELAPVP